MKYQKIARDTFEKYQKSRHTRIYFYVYVDSATRSELRRFANFTKAKLWDIQYRKNYQMLVFEKETNDSYECKTRNHKECSDGNCFCPCHTSN